MALIDILLPIWTVLLLTGAFIPFLNERTWWLRAWTYARLQMVCLLTLTFILYAFWIGFTRPFDAILALFMAVAILFCLRDILPFLPLWPKQTRRSEGNAPHTPLKLLVGNVLMDNENYQTYLEQIKSVAPDLIFLVETNERWREELKALQTLYPFTYLLPLEDYNGMLFYSRFPIAKAQERYLVQDYIPSLTLDLDLGDNGVLRFYGIHPRPPRPEDDTQDLDTELHFIANEAGHQTGPVIVTGDLNDVGWSQTTRKFLRISGLKDPRIGRGLFNSYNAKIPFIRWPLDHVFHSKHFSLIDMRRLKAHGSDHFPLIIELALEKSAP